MNFRLKYYKNACCRAAKRQFSLSRFLHYFVSKLNLKGSNSIEWFTATPWKFITVHFLLHFTDILSTLSIVKVGKILDDSLIV